MKASTLFLVLCALACTAAAQPATSPETSDMQPKTENGVTYLCGGVGLDESTAMKQAAKNYDLMSIFAAQDGSYLADVNVEILGKGDTPILQTTCDGPMLLVKVPQAGSYRIRATIDGHVQTKRVQAGGGRGVKRLVFVWPAAQAGLEQPRSMRRATPPADAAPGS